MSPIILTGDSHLGALRKAQRKGLCNSDTSHITFWPLGRGGESVKKFFRISDDKLSVETTVAGWKNRKFDTRSLSATERRTTFIVSMPLNTSRVLRDGSWHTHRPWNVEGTGTVAISESLLNQMFFEDCQHSVSFVCELKKLGLSVAVLEGPRFFENAEYLAKFPFDVCQYVDISYRNYVHGLLADANIPVIEQPKSTITEYGTTKLEFDHPDPNDNHHANERYGAIVLEQIINHASQIEF